jgi:hypothetical protein
MAEVGDEIPDAPQRVFGEGEAAVGTVPSIQLTACRPSSSKPSGRGAPSKLAE